MEETTHWKMHEEGDLISWESQNKGGYSCGVEIDKKEKVVGVWVEDNYYDFDISFDKFLEIAEKVKEVRGEG